MRRFPKTGFILLFFLCIFILTFIKYSVNIPEAQFSTGDNQVRDSDRVSSEDSKFSLSEAEISPFSGLPDLYISGSAIKRKDTEAPVIFKGVTSMAFVYYDYKIDEFLSLLDKFKNWNINIIGLYLNWRNTQNKLEDLDKVVSWAKTNRIYIFLMPASDPKTEQLNILQEMDKAEALLKIISLRYKIENHVIYGLFAEPRYLSWDFWYERATESVNIIRENNPDALILYTGINWGRNFFISDESFDFTNIIFDYHDYPWTDQQDSIRNYQKALDKYRWSEMTGKYPILVGEFGGVSGKDFGCQQDLDFIQKVLADVNSNKLSYTAYTIDNQGELGLMDWKTMAPTRKGKLIQEDLKKYPPTRF